MPQPTKPVPPIPPAERSGTLIEQGAHVPGRQPATQQSVERSGTVLETDDDIRHAILSTHKGRQPAQAVAVEPPAPIPSAPQQPAAQRGRRLPADRTPASRCADRMRRRQDQRRGHSYSRSSVHHRPHRGGPPHPDRRPDLGAPRRDHPPGRRRAASLGRHRPPEYARFVRAGQQDAAGRQGRVPGRQWSVSVRRDAD